VLIRSWRVAEFGLVGDKFGDRSQELNALAEPGGEPRLASKRLRAGTAMCYK